MASTTLLAAGSILLDITSNLEAVALYLRYPLIIQHRLTGTGTNGFCVANERIEPSSALVRWPYGPHMRAKQTRTGILAS
ncbi:hypothetical protein AB1N83_001876 [Pleurotus pulmonarius]